MASKVKILTVKPWEGGLHTSLEASLIDNTELTKANNTRFTTSFSRQARGGLPYFDYVAVGVQRSSSGMTRTIRVTINSGITIADTDSISVNHATDSNSDYDITTVEVDTITLVSGTTYDITYTGLTGITEAITVDTDIRVGLFTTSKIIGVYDYWYFSSGSKIQKRIAVSDDGTFWLISSAGSKTEIASTGLTLTTPITKCYFEILAEKIIITFSGTGNKPVIWDGSSDIAYVTNIDYDGNDIESVNPMPDIELMMRWNGRIYASDKTDPDRLHYCDINEPRRWNGEGDSAAIILESGDGDTTGIIAIMPPHKGILPVAKRGILYHISGEAPYLRRDVVSTGIGSISHDSSVAVDHDDVAWASIRGFHSMEATSKYGDLESAFISNKIQPTFNALQADGLPYCKGIYDGTINSVLWIVRESGQTSANAILNLNIKTGAWYRWHVNNSEFKVESIGIWDKSSKNQIVLGTYNGRIIEYDEDTEVDLVNTVINMNVKSGIIYPDGSPYHIKGFKTLGILYKTTRQSVTFDIKFKIDNYDEQTFTISQDPSTDLLGSTFVLGASTLGFKEVLLPENLSVDGYGYGCSLEITSSTPVDIYGYVIGYEEAGDQQEVIRS